MSVEAPTIAEQINAAMAAYQESVTALTNHRAEWGPVFEVEAELQQDVDDAKDALTALMAETTDWVENDSFEFNLVRQDRGGYDIDRLPEWVRELPGVVTQTVDKKAIDALIKRRKIAPEDVADAWEPKPAKPFVKVTVKKG